MTLKRIKGQTFYLPGAVNSGIYLYGEKSALIIDTGLYGRTGKKILSLLEDKGVKAEILCITHGHRDHYGGAFSLKKRASLEIVSSPFAATMIENPLLEPLSLYSAEPFLDLKNPSFMNRTIVVDRTFEGGEEVEGIRVVELPGHAPGQVGLITPDGVFFAADSFFGEAIVEKRPLLYFSHIDRALKTLERLPTYAADYFLPGHGDLYVDPQPTIEKNIRSIERISFHILQSIRDAPKSREEILQIVIHRFCKDINLHSYLLNHSIVSAHLGSFLDRGEISYFFKENTMLFRRN